MNDEFSRTRATISSIIDSEFQGKDKHLADAVGYTKQTFSKLMSGIQKINHDRISDIVPVLSTESALALCNAWLEDVLGTDHHKRVFGTDGITPMIMDKALSYRMDVGIKSFCEWIINESARDPNIKAWAIQTAIMVGAITEHPSEELLQESLRVAEDPEEYGKKIIDPEENDRLERNDDGGEANTAG